MAQLAKFEQQRKIGILYVALSRAKSRLMLVVSRTSPSPLLTI